MSKTTNYGNNMRLFTSYWGDKDTFKLMPVTDDCPYAEVIYDVATTLLVVIGKLHKSNYQMVSKLDDDGYPIKSKNAIPGQSPHKQQRVMMDVLQEYYITEKDEQEAFIKEFAVNADTYNYGKFLRDLDSEPTIHEVEKQGITDKNGKPLKVAK